MNMNCSVCENNLNGYLEGKLSTELTKEVINHLKHCESCQELCTALRSLDQLILNEKVTIPSPYLTSRVMNLIRTQNRVIAGENKLQRILQPLLIAASITLAILGGVKAGNIYSTTRANKQVPVELALMDDLSLESVDIITQE
jgi:predicted anti-sigma-YlaC factor YlaD